MPSKLGFIKVLTIPLEKGRVTKRYPFEEPLVSPEFRGRIEIDESKCIGCGACVLACPPNALQLIRNGSELVLKYFIGRCIFCWRCIDVCPVNAIKGTRDFELATDNPDDLRELVIHKRAECSECSQPYVTIRQKQYVISKSPVTENYADLCGECRKGKFIKALELRRGGVGFE